MEEVLQVVGVKAQAPAQDPHIEFLPVEHLVHDEVEASQVGPQGDAHLVQPPLNPDGEGGAQGVVAGAGSQHRYLRHRLAVGHPQTLALLLDKPAVLADPGLGFPGEALALEQFHGLGDAFAPAQTLSDERHVRVVPRPVALRHRGVHGKGDALQHGAGDELLVDEGCHRLPERLAFHGRLAEVEAQVAHAVGGVFDDGQPVLALQLFLQPPGQPQWVEHKVDVSLLQGQHGGVLAAID